MKENELVAVVDSEGFLRVVVAKKDLGSGQVAVVAVGYEGGGCWSNYHAALQLDGFEENVKEFLDRVIFEEDSEEHETDYMDLYQFIDKYIDLDTDEAPKLRPEHFVPENLCSAYYEDYFLFDLNWDWDTDILQVLSKDWQFLFTWSDENE